LGYRGDELLTDSTPRVVALGDSNIQAVFSNLEDTFPKQLEKNLIAELGDKVEVVNAGVVLRAGSLPASDDARLGVAASRRSRDRELRDAAALSGIRSSTSQQLDRDDFRRAAWTS